MSEKKIPPKEMNKILKEMIEGYPKESNVFIAKKAVLEIEKKHGKSLNGGEPLYKEGTITRKVSEFRKKKKGKKKTGRKGKS